MSKIVILEGVKRNIRHNKFLFYVTIIYLCIAFICVELLFLNLNTSLNKQSNSIFNHEENETEIYRLVDDADTTFIIDDYGRTSVLKKFYKDFIEDSHYTYYESFNQPVYVSDFKGNEVFSYNYELTGEANRVDEYNLVNQVYINENSEHKFNLSNHLMEGSSFESEDYTRDNLKEIPIIMGYEYSKYYSIDEILQVKISRNTNATYKIVGFLTKNLPIEINGSVVVVDRYIITPSMTLNYLDKTEDDVLFQGFYYLQKMNGFVELADNYTLQDFMIDFEELRLENNMFEFEILKYSPLEINTLKFLVYENVQTIRFMFVITLLTMVVTVFAYMIYKININMYSYRVLLISGYSVRDIKKIVMLEFCLTFAIPLLVAVGLLNFFMESVFKLSIVFTGIIYMSLFCIIFVLTKIYFDNIDIERLVKGEKYD